VAYHYLGKPQTLYFDAWTQYSAIEVRVVRELIPNTIIENATINLGTREVGKKAYIPFRNMYFAGLATYYSDSIVIAGLKDDLVSDKNAGIFDSFSELFSEMEDRRIRVWSPFWEMTKAQVVKWYLENGGTKEELLKTFSCYQPKNGGQCWACPACFRKWNALWMNGIKVKFENFDLIQEYRRSALEGKYDPERRESILQATEEFSKDTSF
jgi:7-cyano-7-deazaguanine synthase in queuosine biosynthesis